MTENQKIRVPNFSVSEKTHLMRIIAYKFASILEDKKTDRASSVHKEKAWQEIEKEFNASSTSSTYRSSTSLKKCYENRKKEFRKSLAEERKEIMLTGGGPPPKIKKDETDDILISILNKKTLVGLNNPYDDDAEGTPVEVNPVINNETIFEYIVETSEEPISQAIQSTSASTTAFKTALPETKQAEPPKNPEIPANIKLAQLDNWKKYTPKQLQTTVSAALTFPKGETEKNSSGGDQQTPKKSTSRRRPTTIVKPMTSSDVALKYNLLLDKRLQLVDAQLKHFATESDLIVKKHKLEIEILELEVQKKRENI